MSTIAEDTWRPQIPPFFFFGLLRPERTPPFPNRVVQPSKKSKTPEARLASRLVHLFGKQKSQSSDRIAGPEHDEDLDEIY